MNYIEQIRGFWKIHEVTPVPISAIALYYHLLEINNKAGWAPSFKRNNAKICADLGISYPTLCNAREALKDAGIIDFKTQNGNANVLYTLKKFLKVTNEVDGEVTYKVTNEVANEVADKVEENAETLKKSFEVTDEVNIEVGDKVDVPQQKPLKNFSRLLTSKDKHKLKQNKEVENSASRFAPPSLVDVEKYFTEKGYSAEAGRKAWEYYDAAEWKDSKGKQVRNWKQKMIAVWFKPENKIASQQPEQKLSTYQPTERDQWV